MLPEILVREWFEARKRHGRAIGRYVIMPDHVHFFCAPELDAKPLSLFVGFWKEWTSKSIKRKLGLTTPIWQDEFFDHVLRSSESYSEKWDYVRNNPVRAQLISCPEDWPWQGEVESSACSRGRRPRLKRRPASTPPATMLRQVPPSAGASSHPAIGQLRRVDCR
jgi:putative transposase